MGVKQNIKGLVPPAIWRKLQRAKCSRTIAGYQRAQRRRFLDHCAGPWNTGSGQLRGQLVYFVHRVEKGLSHTGDFRSGFGRSALTRIAGIMRQWRDAGYPLDDKAYQAAEDVIRAYVRRHDELGAKIPEYVYDLFGGLPDEQGRTDPLMSGTRTIRAADKTRNHELDYATLFRNRCSVREFAAGDVDPQRVHEAIAICMKTPSVCNRQASRVLLVEDPETIGRALALQGGWRGCNRPPLLALVTVDVREFVSAEERNEPYIDGGLFAMAFLTALEYEGLAACPLNTMCRKEQEQQLRALLGIPDHETMIMFVAIGRFAQETRVPMSFRYDGASITREITGGHTDAGHDGDMDSASPGSLENEAAHA